MRLLYFTILIFVCSANASFAQKGQLARGTHQKIQAGDPSAIPTVKLWLNDPTLLPNEAGEVPERMTVALMGVGHFRLKETLPTLMKLYQHPKGSKRFRGDVLRAITRINPKEAIPFFERELKGGLLNQNIRFDVASALVMHDNDTGREFLLNDYREHLKKLKAGETSKRYVRMRFSRMNDEKLLTELKKLLPQQDAEATILNVRNLIRCIELNRMSEAELIKIIHQTDWQKHKFDRHAAIDALGFFGSHKAIDELKKIQPWENIAEERKKQAPQYLEQTKQNAIGRLKQRHWRYLLSLSAPSESIPR